MKESREERYEKAKRRIKDEIERSAQEILKNGFASIWVDGQWITDATITVHIGEDMVAFVKYEKEVYPAP